MEVSSFGVFSILVALLSGGAHDLLDFVSTDAYWKAKGVTVSVEQLIADLKSPDGADVSDLIKNLGSSNYAKREEAAKSILAHGPAAIPSLEKFADDPDPEIASRVKTLSRQIQLESKAAGVRKLMAIRTLGEMKKSEGLATLRTLTSSKEMFVADYASRAIAQIEGKPLPVQRVKPDALKSDLAILPPNCAVLGQVAMVSGDSKVLSFDEAIKTLPAKPGENLQALVDQLAAQVIQIADQVGNVRVESISFGVADVVGPQDGFAVFVVRGQYDAQAALALLRKLIPGANNVAGVDVFTPNPNMALVFPGNDRALFMTGASQEKLPVKELLTAIANGANGKGPATHPLLTQPEIAPLITTLGDARLWAVCKVSDSYRGAPVIQAFDVITVVGRQKKEGVEIRFDASGKDAAAVNGAVGLVNQGLNDAKNHLPQMAQQMPMLQPIADLVAGINCTANDKKASLTGNFKGDTTTLLTFPFMVFGARAQPVPAPAALPQPQPVPRGK